MYKYGCKHCEYYDPANSVCQNERITPDMRYKYPEHRTPDDWCTRLSQKICKYCTGQLEARSRIFNGKKEAWWHCYSCHMEFPVEE